MLLHLKKSKEILLTRSLLGKTVHKNWGSKMFQNNSSHVNIKWQLLDISHLQTREKKESYPINI